MNPYMQEVQDDLRTAIKENADGWASLSMDEYRDKLSDPAWTDGITGNASGSYYCNRYKAQEMVEASNVLFDEKFLTMLDEYGVNLADIMKKGPEAVDVWARCIALESLDDETIEEIRRDAIKDRVEALVEQNEIFENLSYGEIIELQGLAPWILEHYEDFTPDAAELAGIPEEDWNAAQDKNGGE